jgi:acyl-coenzyme A thioesterase PaaI-like protein
LVVTANREGLGTYLSSTAQPRRVGPTPPSQVQCEEPVKFLRGLDVAVGPVRCEGRVLHSGRRTALAEARLTDAAGRLYAHATSTCMVLRKP